MSFKRVIYPLQPTCDKLFLDLQTFQIYKNLSGINQLPKRQAESAFLRCCGSSEWARRMTNARPFAMLEDLFESAEKIWRTISHSDQLEAFAAERSWSGLDHVELSPETRIKFAEANRLYESKFGFIFIVNTSRRSAEEILAICRARVGNSVKTELEIAALELLLITEARLVKFLEQ